MHKIILSSVVATVALAGLIQSAFAVQYGFSLAGVLLLGICLFFLNQGIGDYNKITQELANRRSQLLLEKRRNEKLNKDNEVLRRQTMKRRQR